MPVKIDRDYCDGGADMVKAETSVMRELCRIQEQLLFLAHGLQATGDEAINGETGLVDARVCTGAATLLADVVERLNMCIDG